MPSPFQTADAIARLERYRRMITLDEAVEIFTGRETPFTRRAREAARNLWLDISHAATAPFRKAEDVIEGELMIPLSELELYLRRCRKVGYIEQLGMEVRSSKLKAKAFVFCPAIFLPSLPGGLPWSSRIAWPSYKVVPILLRSMPGPNVSD